MAMPQLDNPLFAGDSDDNDNESENVDADAGSVDSEDLPDFENINSLGDPAMAAASASEMSPTDSPTTTRDSPTSEGDSPTSTRDSQVSTRNSSISSSDSAVSPNTDSPSNFEGTASNELPLADVLLLHNGGVDNKAFVPDTVKSVDDEESKKSFLPVNGTKKNGVNGHVETKDDKTDNAIVEEEDKDGDDPRFYCGFGTFRPNVMQRCKTMGCFTLSFSLTGIVTSALSIYINSQITTLEKHFDFSSSVSGFLMSCNDLGYLSTTLFMSFYARRLHIPRALAISTFIYGLSGLMCTVAFFGTRNQLPSPPTGRENLTKVASMSFTQMCANLTRSGNATCEEISQRAKNTFEVSDEWRTAAIFIIGVGMLMQGVAKSPRQSFLGTYVDDNVPKTKTTMYLGTMVGLSIFGPAVAFFLGGVFSKMYITLEETNITPRDPRWLGAWWVGFLIFGALGLIAGIPLIFFPKRMRKKKELDEIRQKEKLAKIGQKRVLHDIKGFLKSILHLILNPVYMCLVFSSGINLMGVSGMMAFMPKYMETQFTIPAWQANMMLGAMNVLSASGGTIVGGILTSRLKLPPLTCLKVMIGCMTLSSLLMSLGFVIGCDQPAIETGLRNGSLGSSTSMCIQGCNCDEQNFFPVCGGDGKNYFSPCHAGCSSMDQTMAFANCTCLATNASSTATGGLCEPACNNLYPYMGMTLIAAFVTTIIIMPSFVVSVRSVKEADKPLAIGLSAFLGTLIGWFPGPVIFGNLVDSTCLIWKTSCTSVGACSLYNIVSFRFRIHLLMTGLRVATLFLLLVALLIALCSKKPVFQPHEDITVNHSTKKPEKEKGNQVVDITDMEIRETSIV